MEGVGGVELALHAGVNLWCIIVTYRRPSFARTLELALSQTRPPDLVVVVDNEGSEDVRHTVHDAATRGAAVHYIRPEENTGPAGGTAIAMSYLLENAHDQDWITRLDDDRVEMDDDVFEELLRFGLEQHDLDSRVGAVGAVGSRYDWRRGRLRRISDEEIAAGPVCVDYVPTNVYPAYRVAAVRDVGVFDAELFGWFEEVEYGLRLRKAGYELRADPVLWQRLGRASAETSGPTWSARPLDWRRYYSLRNQIYVLRRNGHTWTAVKVALVRGLAKPLANLLVHPQRGLAHVRLDTRAVRDGFLGRLGRRVEPW